MTYTGKGKIPDELIEKVNSLNLVDLASVRGYAIEKHSTEYRIKGQQGLIIKSDGTSWNHVNEKVGGGPIQLVMHMEGKTWRESTLELLGIEGSEQYQHIKRVSHSTLPEERQPLVLPERNKDYRKMFAYLLKSRHLDPEIVQGFVDRKQLYQDTKGNCVFVGYDNDNTPKFASLRGTNSNVVFRGDVKNSSKEYSFNLKGDGKTLCVFESPIDLMSYMTLLKLNNITTSGRSFISVSGVNTVPIDKFLSENKNIEKIVMCVDDDKGGHDFIEKVKETYSGEYRVEKHVPQAKDFNEQLKNLYEKTVEVEEVTVKLEEALEI